jgi:hypothetical protein
LVVVPAAALLILRLPTSFSSPQDDENSSNTANGVLRFILSIINEDHELDASLGGERVVLSAKTVSSLPGFRFLFSYCRGCGFL